MITYIHRNKLEPHPDNPRKELGDLSELAASIRKQGILQNLTVVPSPDAPDKYRIVIGNRRFAASGIAGLEELPCAIDDGMTYPEQIAVMMSENMQRSDLTIAERVGGVQMMMDLGMDAGAVADATGLSNSSVRRYTKLRALPRGGMAQAEQRGATLMQMLEISQIEDDKLRAEALNAAGTDEFGGVMYRVRAERTKRDRLPPMLDKLSGFAVEIESSKGYVWETNFSYSNADVLKEIGAYKRKAGVRYGYIIGPYVVALYKELEQRDDAKAQARAEAAERLRAKIAREKEMAQAFRKMRDDWMTNEFNPRGKDGSEAAAMRFVLWALARPGYLESANVGGRFDYCCLPERENLLLTGDIKLSMDEVAGIADKGLPRAIALIAYDRISGRGMWMMDSAGGLRSGDEAERVREFYACMEAMGYPVSADERAWLDGTHECFA